MLLPMVHDLSPFILRISGEFGIRWYGLAYVGGFIAAYLMISWLVRRQRADLSSAQVMDFITYAAFGTILGGRLGYCLFYAPDLFLKFKSSFPFWGVFAVNEGGMASHGGMIGLVIAAWLFAAKYQVNKLYLFDLMTVSGPVGVFFGRIANFINGELVGRPAPENFPLAVKFPQDIWLWPTQELERLGSLQPVVEKLGVTSSQWTEWIQTLKTAPSSYESVMQILYKIVNEIQNGNTAVKEAIAPFLTPRHPSQLYGALGEGFFVFLVLFLMWSRPQKPGVIGATFLILYGTVRILDEQFRMPDAHIGFQLFGLTRGQWLSIVMVLIGIVLTFIWSRSSALAIPGWRLGQNIKLGRKG